MVLLSSPLRGEGRIGGSISGLALIILFLFYWLRSVSKLKPYFLLLIFSLLLLLPGIASLPVIDRDEAHFTQATRQMIQNNNYFQIRFQDITRFQKPPGINWLQAASVKVFSHADAKTMWPYRLPSLLGALFSVLFTYFFARRFYDPKTAAMGAGLLACALLLVAEAHMAVIDSMLLFSVVLMQGALWVIYEKEDSHWGWALCFWLALSFGLVLKGVTPLVAVLSIITLCIIDKKVSFLKRLHPIKGFILFLGLTLTWLWGVNEAEHSNYLMQMIHKDLLPKLQGGHESHGKPPLFHLAILPITFWPGSLFLWQVLYYGFTQRKEKSIRFLLAWVVPTWIFFELMPTKLPQYVLPTFPAIAVLMALSFTHLTQKPNKRIHLLQLLWIVLSIGLGLALGALPYLILGTIPWESVLLVSGITILSVVSVYYAWQAQFSRAALACFLMALLTYPLVFGRILPQLTPIWLTNNLVKSLDVQALSANKPLLVVGFEEPSLVFNLNTKLVLFTNYETALTQLKADPKRMVVIPEEVFAQLPLEMQKPLLQQQSISGFNYSKGQWVKLLVLKLK